MASLITSGRKNFCKSLQGGIKRVYLAAFAPYNRSEFGFDGAVLTYLPTTFVHEFELNGNTNSFSVGFNGESYDQRLSLEFKKQDSESSKQMAILNYMELRALVQDNNGNFLIFGLDNGLNSDSLEILTGGAKSELNGYRIQFTGKEKHSAPIVLDPFDNGFIVVDEDEDFYQYQNLIAFLFQDGTTYHFN